MELVSIYVLSNIRFFIMINLLYLSEPSFSYFESLCCCKGLMYLVHVKLSAHHLVNPAKDVVLIKWLSKSCTSEGMWSRWPKF